jgi:hypothetical protein
VAGSARPVLERGGDAGGELGRAAALDEIDERVDVHTLVAGERGRPAWEENRPRLADRAAKP